MGIRDPLSALDQLSDLSSARPMELSSEQSTNRGTGDATVYLRWRRRPRAEGADLLIASIVASTRQDGKSRQHQLAYIASIRDDQRLDVVERTRVWDALDRVLDQLALEPEVDKRLVNQLHITVPHPEIEPAVVPTAVGTQVTHPKKEIETDGKQAPEVPARGWSTK